jgi:hypothetical protein
LVENHPCVHPPDRRGVSVRSTTFALAELAESVGPKVGLDKGVLQEASDLLNIKVDKELGVVENEDHSQQKHA